LNLARPCYTGAVRGDSLRDFQAKVLAIAGLGVLAGIGALVDYWPTGTNVPAIQAGSLARPGVPVPTPASVAAAREIEIETTVPLPALPVTRRARSVTQPATLEPVATIAAAGALPIGEPLPLAAVELSLTQVVPSAPPAPATSAPAEPIALPAPPVIASVENRTPYTPSFAPTFVAPESEPGFVMGTLKKTGAGIAKGSAVTGASIMDAFRGVAGAFKKVSPFRDRGFIESN
jgi:hypothetical protein